MIRVLVPFLRRPYGLGDLIHALTEVSGIGRVVRWVARRLGVDCGCVRRRAYLNSKLAFLPMRLDPSQPVLLSGFWPILAAAKVRGRVIHSSGGGGGGGPLTCDDSSATTTSAGLQTFLDGITTGGTEGNPRVLCLTENISLTSQVTWDVPDHVVLWGGGAVGSNVGASGGITFTDNYTANSPTLLFSGIDNYFRFTGFTYAGPITDLKESGNWSFSGDTTQLRLDHYTYTGRDTDSGVKRIVFNGCLYGVIDHVVYNVPNTLGWIHYVNGTCDDNAGHSVWAAPTGFGGPNFMYMEDSQWNNEGDASVSTGTISDCHSGGKFVIRFTTVKGASIGQTHGFGHSGEDRGCRAHEIYGTTTALHTAGDDPSWALAASNAGTSLIWGNAVGSAVEAMLMFVTTRADNSTYGQGPTPNDTGYCGTEFSGTGSAYDENANTTTGYRCMDDVGRGQGDLMSGNFPNFINTTTGNISWPNQAQEPVYEWLNTGTPTNTYINNFSASRIAQNRDYYLYNGNSSCNQGAGSCTAGVGSGTLAQRPTNCTTGVAWWATDQGSWNTSASNPEGVQQNGANGVLYKCTATNTWTLYYTPYTYPHPLNT